MSKSAEKMAKKKLGRNRGIWSGIVVSPLTLSHELKKRDDDTIIERFYKFEVETEYKELSGEVVDLSKLPVIISESKLKELDEEVAVGKIVFLKGSWRTYDNDKSSQGRTKLEQNIHVKSIEIHNEYTVRTRNKFEFEGFLVKKLFELERDEDGNHKKDEQGRLIPKRNEEGELKYTVRKNKENEIVNDIIIAINRPNGSDYIPCIAYRELAEEIATNIEVGERVQGSAYIRSREYTFAGQQKVAFEACITSLKLKKEDEEKEE